VPQARQPGRQPTGQVEEMELLDVLGQPPQLRRERGKEGVAQLRVMVDQLPEDVPGKGGRSSPRRQ